MPTTKKRVNITVTDEMLDMLKALAKRDSVPIATKAKDLLAEMLEYHEDQIWAELAEEREKTSNGKYLSHEEVWSQFTD